ncbi:hypothetical protein L484_000475 [Morus notabilis]|uniref:Uncharacterized protein n=1 Tax=Morus notabilis TaxID=981085 RepID=W9SP63_9ROSA|nr:hypothetical protein L484_000475 [Morus notabilis]
MRHETVVSSTLQRIAETISARATKSRSSSVSAISCNARLMECKKILESMDLEMSLYIRTLNMMDSTRILTYYNASDTDVHGGPLWMAHIGLFSSPLPRLPLP